jgi:hypothetical protein
LANVGTVGSWAGVGYVGKRMAEVERAGKRKGGGCWVGLRKTAQEAWMEGNPLFYFQNTYINYKLF